MVNQATNTNNAGNAGLLTITVTQASQDWLNNWSWVRVQGTMKNVGSGSSSGSGVTCDIGGDQSFTGSKFSFNLGPQAAKTFIDHTFKCVHGSDGFLHVNFSVEFGDTGTGTFGGGSSASIGLELDRIPQRPDKPQNLHVTAIKPTSISLAWDPPIDDHGSPVKDYDLRYYRTFDLSDQPTHNHGNSRTRNITNLDAGGSYWFTVVAINSAAENGGVSNESNTVFNQMQPGFWIRHNGEWTTCDVYVRHNGVWELATPYVRNGQTVDGVGFWKTTI